MIPKNTTDSNQSLEIKLRSLPHKKHQLELYVKPRVLSWINLCRLQQAVWYRMNKFETEQDQARQCNTTSFTNVMLNFTTRLEILGTVALAPKVTASARAALN